MNRYFITAIGTDSGKTIVSAIFCEAFGADYWKPVQAGLPADTDTVRALVTRNDIVFHAEAYRLIMPASPHASAKAEGKTIKLDLIQLPHSSRPMVVEGAGGCLVPLNDQNFVVDIAVREKIPVVLVSNYYLGSINHTLLTIEALKARGVELIGIVFNGAVNEESKKIILHHSGLPILLEVEAEPVMDKETIRKYAKILHANWTERTTEG